MTADALGLCRDGGEAAQPGEDLVFSRQGSLQMGRAEPERGHLAEDLARQAACPVVESLAVEGGERLRGEVRVTLIRGQCGVHLGCALSEQGRPLQVRADERVGRLESSLLSSDEKVAGRRQVELRIAAGGQGPPRGHR